MYMVKQGDTWYQLSELRHWNVVISSTVASPSSAPTDCPEVTTKLEYIDLHHTSFTSTLPGDVVHLSLQVKTVKGMHTIHRDAWSGHSQHFRKWGTQITLTAATRNKLEKFKSQWNAFVRGTTQGRGRRNRGKKYSSYCAAPTPSLLHQLGHWRPHLG